MNSCLAVAPRIRETKYFDADAQRLDLTRAWRDRVLSTLFGTEVTSNLPVLYNDPVATETSALACVEVDVHQLPALRVPGLPGRRDITLALPVPTSDAPVRDISLVVPPAAAPAHSEVSIDMKTRRNTAANVAMDRGNAAVSVETPYGADALPRFINAATLRAIVGARPYETLFRKVGPDNWVIVEKHEPIDLADSSVEYRVAGMYVSS